MINNNLSCVQFIALQSQVSARLWENNIRTRSQPTLHLSASPPGIAPEHCWILQLAPLHSMKIWGVNGPAFSFPSSSSCKRSQPVPSVLGVTYSERIKGAHFLVFLKSAKLCEGWTSQIGRYHKCRTWLWKSKQSGGGIEVTILK